MGVMERFRTGTKYIFVLLILSFGLLWVLADVNFFETINAGPNALGSVNGDRISNEEYQGRITYYTNLYTQQTGESMSPEMRAYYENQVWEELVNQRLIDQKMEELGITVTDEELLDMVYGDNPAALIRQNFSREDGTIDRALINQVLTDEQYSQAAISFDIQLRQERRQQKLSNFITSGFQITDAEVEQAYLKESSSADVSFVRFPFSSIAADEISISDSDLNAYYNANKENYKQDESYRLKFVTFSTLPTAEDTLEIIREVENLRERFASAPDDSLFLVNQFSDMEYNLVTVNRNDIREEYQPVNSVGVGEVTEVFLSGGQAVMIKKTAQRGSEVSFVVFGRMIEALPSTLDSVGEKADDFQFFAIDSDDFDGEAERLGLSVEEGFATKGNAFISGLGNSQQILNFLERRKVGAISEVYELPSEYAVVQIIDKEEEGYRPLAEVRTQVENAVRTEKRKELAVEKMKSLLANNSSIEALATAAELEVQTANSVRGQATVLTGAGREPELIGSIFALEEGATSPVLAGNTGAFVIRVDSKSDANLEALTDVRRAEIRTRLENELNQRFLTVWIDELRKEAKITDNRSRLIQG